MLNPKFIVFLDATFYIQTVGIHSAKKLTKVATRYRAPAPLEMYSNDLLNQIAKNYRTNNNFLLPIEGKRITTAC